MVFCPEGGKINDGECLIVGVVVYGTGDYLGVFASPVVPASIQCMEAPVPGANSDVVIFGIIQEVRVVNNEVGLIVSAGAINFDSSKIVPDDAIGDLRGSIIFGIYPFLSVFNYGIGNIAGAVVIKRYSFPISRGGSCRDRGHGY